MTGSSVLVKNTLWNFAGLVAPIGVAILCLPIIIGNLGTEKFGVLSIAWMVIGYFTLFDLGLGRALTKLVAEKLGHEHQEELPELVWTGSLLMISMGILGAAVLGLLAPYLVNHVFKVPDGIRQETVRTFYLLAFAIPVVISTTGFRGVLEAHQRFDLTSAVRISMGAFMFLGPLFVLPFSRDLFWIVIVLVAGRIVVWGVYLHFCFRVLPGLKRNVSPKARLVRPLLSFGGWMTVSNVVSPLMAYLDRFLIGALISMTAVAYYSTPWEVVTKLLVIPGAVVGVLFPAFSYSSFRDPQRAELLYKRGMKYIFFAMFPIVFLVFSFAKEGLYLWLGSEFAENGYLVMQLLAVGILLNGVASIPFALIQGMGRPDITAIIHLAEVIFYIPATWWLVRGYGLTGAALSWLFRVGIDAILLLFFAARILGTGAVRKERTATIGVVFAVGTFLITANLPFQARVPFVGIALALMIIATWSCFLDMDEKAFISEKVVGVRKLFHFRR